MFHGVLRQAKQTRENCFSYIVLKTLHIWLIVAGEVAAYCEKSPAPNATAELCVTFQTSEIVQYSTAELCVTFQTSEIVQYSEHLKL